MNLQFFVSQDGMTPKITPINTEKNVRYKKLSIINTGVIALNFSLSEFISVD